MYSREQEKKYDTELSHFHDMDHISLADTHALDWHIPYLISVHLQRYLNLGRMSR
jgi:hypothetical protein